MSNVMPKMVNVLLDGRDRPFKVMSAVRWICVCQMFKLIEICGDADILFW